jgi:predicted CoA-binding protein
MKKTVVIGASPDPHRYSHRAVTALKSKGYDVVAVGLHEGKIDGVTIHTDLVPIENVGTVTVYVHPRHQGYWKDYIVSLHPERVIFNPGAENPELLKALRKEGIDTQESCTLVMLTVGTF